MTMCSNDMRVRSEAGLKALMLVSVLAGWGGHACADWPQLQGLRQDGISDDVGLADHWPPAGPLVVWRAPLGVGFGGPAVNKGRVYLLDRIDDEKDVIRCFDLASGEQLWRWENSVAGRLTYNGSRSVPTVADDHIFAVGPFGHVYCVNKETHDLLWTINVFEDFQKEPPKFGYVQCPLLYRDTVIISVASETVGLVALERNTGEVVWRSQPLGTLGYVSPRLHRFDGTDAVVVVTEVGVISIDVTDGELLWKYSDYNPVQAIAFPTIIDGNRMFVTAGDDAGSVMLKVSKRDRFEVDRVFALPNHGAQLHPPLFWEGYLYGKFNTYETMADSSRKLVSRFLCLDMEGNITWQIDDRQLIERGNWLIADGKLFILDGSTGELAMVSVSPDSYQQLAKAKVLEGKPHMISPMALNGGMLIVRDNTEMRCIDLRRQ